MVTSLIFNDTCYFCPFDCRFVDINNAHDTLTIRVGLSKSDQLAEQRAALLNKLHILPGNQTYTNLPFYFYFTFFSSLKNK